MFGLQAATAFKPMILKSLYRKNRFLKGLADINGGRRGRRGARRRRSVGSGDSDEAKAGSSSVLSLEMASFAWVPCFKYTSGKGITTPAVRFLEC